MTDWVRVLRAVSPRGKSAIITGFADALPGLVDEFDLNTVMRQAHFLAQTAHESDGFNAVTEYASGRAYEGRKDLGNTRAGDGPRYKGRGLIQLTGRANYRKFGAALGVDLENEPELAADFPYAARTAGLYWKLHGLNRLADANDIRGITRAINGGYNGLEDRTQRLALALHALSGASAPASPFGGLARVGLLSAGDDAVPTEDAVRAAQERLKDLGYFPGMIDGNMGGATRGALAAFQTDHHIPVTSDLDAETTEVLGSSLARRRPIADARANATVQDLRDAGSETIAAADDAQSGLSLKALAGTAGVGLVTDTISQADNAKEAVGKLPGLLQFAVSHATLIAVVIIVGVVWWQRRAIVKALDRVRQARLHDHKSFRNAGR